MLIGPRRCSKNRWRLRSASATITSSVGRSV